MSTATPRLCLILQNIVQTAPFTGSAIPAVATERLLTFLVDFGLWQWPIYVSTDQRPQAKLFDSLDDLVREASAWTDWVTLKSCGGLETEVELVIHDRESAVHCFVPVDTSAKDDMLSCLTALAIELWSALRDHVVVGPIFSIRP